MSVGLSVTRRDDEEWRDCVIRYASKYGLEDECLSYFDKAVAGGTDAGEAAWQALGEWDVLDFYDDAKPEGA